MLRLLDYFILILFVIQEIITKNHFKGIVFKDPYKIKRLAIFRNDLCKEIDGLKNYHHVPLIR